MNIISSSNAPAAIGPYSQAIESNGFVFCSGQLGIDPATKALAQGIEAQVEQIFSNITAVLAEAGCELSDVIKTTVFLSDLGNFSVFNNIYAKRFGTHKPARSTVQVARLPMDALVEIECIAVKKL